MSYPSANYAIRSDGQRSPLEGITENYNVFVSGITGWAQVNYPYGESEEDAIQKLTYDLYYILRHYSLKLDAMIVLKTIYTMFAGKGR